MPPVNRRPAYRPSPPLPPLWLAPERPIDPVPLAQFVLLSMLLHGLAITLFGAPAGGSREGRAMWGSLEVTLLGPPREAPAVPRLEREASVMPAPPRAPAPPKAVPPAPPAEPVPLADSAAPPTVEPLAFPPLLDRLAPAERPLDLPELKIPLPAEAPKPAPPTPIPAPIEPITPRVLPTPMETPAIPVPVPAVPRAPAARVEPIPLEPIPAPIEPLAPRVLPTPLEAPALPTPPVERVPLEVPAIPVPRADAIVPRSESSPATSTGQPEVRETPAPPAPQPQQRAPASPAERAPATAPRVPAEAAPSPFRTPPAARPGAESSYDPTAPSLDTDALRRRAAQLGREGTGNRALLPFPMPAPPEKKGKMETAIEKARKPDCRTAYAEMGLLAVVPLIANEFGEGSCRW